MTGYDAFAGVAISLVTAGLGYWKGLSGGWRQLIVIVLSAAVSVLLASKSLTVSEYLQALAAVFASANAAHAAVKYTARAVNPEGAEPDVATQ